MAKMINVEAVFNPVRSGYKNTAYKLIIFCQPVIAMIL